MSEATALIEVTSFHPGPIGGGVMLGREPGQRGGELKRARIPVAVLPRVPAEGETWRVTGAVQGFPVREMRTGRTEEKAHIVAEWAAPVAPRGAAIRRWIARNPAIKGVGEGYADRLWDAYGPALYDMLRARDVGALATVLDREKASAVVEAFGLLLDEVTALEELDRLGLDGRTANAALRLFGGDAGRRFKQDPYALTLLEPWKKADAAALSGGMSPRDPRRLLAAVEVATARAFRTTESNLGGHTVVPRAPLCGMVKQMLGRSAGLLADEALALALRRGALVEAAPDRFQGRAPAHMEREIERLVAERLARPRPAPDRAVIAAVIGEVEREDGIRLAPEQRDAVVAAFSSRVLVIAGGAGTGKSTVVKSIRRVHLRLRKGDYAQVALSGRAAHRLAEATGAPAMTICRFLKHAALGRVPVANGLLVVDEFSMVGTPDLWLLLAAAPVEADVVLVGDPAQLPPIRAGNPAEAFLRSRLVPNVTLRVPQRQAASTGIPQVAAQMREGFFPELPAFDPAAAGRPGVFLHACGEDQVPAAALSAFGALAGPHLGPRLHGADVQILAMTKRGPAGAAELADAVERRWVGHLPGIHDWGFRVGSRILWTRNSYDRPTGRLRADGQPETTHLMNGSIGVFVSETVGGAEARFDDGNSVELARADLEQLLRGWAITVHKAQGSAFRAVVIPVVQCRLLDRAMIYTAVTRARVSAVLVGEPARVRRAVAEVPRASGRLQALDLDRAVQRAGVLVADGQATA